jgi:hypothetical protein
MYEDLIKLNIFNRITFLQNNHKYLIDGKPTNTYSVTGLLDTVKQPFERNKWLTIKAKDNNTTKEVIEKEWLDKKNYGLSLGTIVHNYIENFYTNKIISYNQDHYKQLLGEEKHKALREQVLKVIPLFNNFYEQNNFYLPIKTEFVVGDMDDTKICGMVDVLMYNTKTQSYEIIDYKTNKEFNLNSRFNKKLLPPVQHLDDCEFNTYSLQINLYKYIIEKYCGIKIGACKVLWLNAQNETYKEFLLLDLQAEVKNMLDYYKENLVIRE